MITLRPDQAQAVEELRGALKIHQSVLLHAECGWGKTVAAAYMAQGAMRKKRRVIFGVHRRELYKQTAKTFERFGIPFGYIAAGQRVDPFAYVQIASIDTLRRKPHLIPCDLFVPDEAHLWLADTRSDVIAQARASGAHIVPLTATPEAGNGRGLAPIADHIIHGPDASWLIENGHLAKYRAYAPVIAETDKLRIRAGEYAVEDVDAEFSKPKVIGDRITAYQRLAAGKRMIGYCYSRKNGEETAAQFRAAGISAQFLDGDTPDDVRTDMIAAFADGRIQVLINCQLFREGFDLSAQVGRTVPIEAVGLWTPTKSLPLAVQMMMRPMRPQPNPAILLDHVNMFREHGLPDSPREWSLAGRAKPKKGDAGEPTLPTSRCDTCLFVGKPFKVCPECKTPVPVGEGRVVKEVAGDLEEINNEIEARRRAAAYEVQSARTIDELGAVARRREYKPGWIVNKMKARGQTVTLQAAIQAMRKIG